MIGAGLTASASESANAQAKDGEPFLYCLNTSTLMGQKLDLVELVEIAARAGYQAIEPWINGLENHVKAGGRLKVLGQRIRDRGLTVESTIGFAEWIVNNSAQRKKGLEEARKQMDMVQQIGGKRLAAPPAGATKESSIDLLQAAERYRGKNRSEQNASSS